MKRNAVFCTLLQSRDHGHMDRLMRRMRNVLCCLFGILAVGGTGTYTLIPGQATDGRKHHQVHHSNQKKTEKVWDYFIDELNVKMKVKC